jgi:pimeloyl-ACP methyl ester carboxylesterase
MLRLSESHPSLERVVNERSSSGSAVVVYEMIQSGEGVRIALHDLGGPTSSEIVPVLLFSHATGFHGRVFEPMASYLNDRFRCVSLDLRGHGVSDMPADVGLAWPGMADDVLAALKSEGFPAGPLHGIGHSMGGAALALAAARRPDAFRSLWLFEPVIVPPGEGGLLPTGDNPMSEAAARRRDRFESRDRAYENYRSKPPLNQLHPDALRAYVDGGFTSTHEGSVTLRCTPATEAEVFRHAAASGAWEAIAALDVPVAVVAGRPDERGPWAFAKEIADALPQGTHCLQSQVGHFGPLEDPAAMAALVSIWIQSHE